MARNLDHSYSTGGPRTAGCPWLSICLSAHYNHRYTHVITAAEQLRFYNQLTTLSFCILWVLNSGCW